MGSDAFTIRGTHVFVDIEFLPPKPPVSDAIDRTDVILAFTLKPNNDWKIFLQGHKRTVLMKGFNKVESGPSKSALRAFSFQFHLQNHLMNDQFHSLPLKLGFLREFIRVVAFVFAQLFSGSGVIGGGNASILVQIVQNVPIRDSDLRIEEDYCCFFVTVVHHLLEEVLADPEAQNRSSFLCSPTLVDRQEEEHWLRHE
ncbi:hypothetical protein Tco_0210681 [Tanacetum coccineum]